ncbi:MAG: hypothetical protein Q7T42_07635 [Methylotenera sp.]|uniref:hypothetical protein n=1 Tax=Methylotenera sp. TaxID=2051956 RepID=UPI00271E5F38|nr:hypothetical protein [Methylotenera sp.]MDO9393826.1 hypothetical protein [Methylotenera sp.]
MSQIHIVRNGAETAFSRPFKRALFRDKRITFGAKGVFATLWDFPDGWIFYLSFIVGMSPGGITQLKTYLKELKYFGAISIVLKRLSAEEALEMTKRGFKVYKAGQVVGRQWILNHPDLWAIDFPLSNQKSNEQPLSPKDRFSDLRENHLSVMPSVGESTPKVLQLEGSANIRPLPQDNDLVKVPSGSADYIFPKQLTSQEREIAKPQLDVIDSALAQAILDELAARLNANKVTGAPLSYLRSLITRANTGQFMPEAGIRVAAAREQAKLVQLKKAAEVIKPSNPSEIPKHLAAMHQVLGRKSTSNLNQED